ncbi:hypothetical protein Pyrfu_0571 [Pyrolobus fumarii 1A]|uniref:Uncharacterized protein n=1 Tax=Pyrolobus fumarii (strain DSM 11204 / 1A) TaxID=694429 RepID=G0EGZ1_PYRF1|nr:hypothetical protein Pyrfu_0571 [Pyrolobus fumarii 1A]
MGQGLHLDDVREVRVMLAEFVECTVLAIDTHEETGDAVVLLDCGTCSPAAWKN